MTQHATTRRRGAPVPLETVEPPPHLNASAKKHFRNAASSRPGFWTSADVVLLTAWSCAAARAEQLERDPSLATSPREYSRCITEIVRIGRALRLTPNARADEEAKLAAPKLDPNTLGGGAARANDMPAGGGFTFDAHDAGGGDLPWRSNGTTEGHA